MRGAERGHRARLLADMFGAGVFPSMAALSHGISSSNEAMEGIFMGPTCPAA